jgi:hypothetical protein
VTSPTPQASAGERVMAAPPANPSASALTRSDKSLDRHVDFLLNWRLPARGPIGRDV